LTSHDALEVLDVKYNGFTHNGASQFFELLPQMKGLKKVYGLVIMGLGVGVPPTEAVGMALVDGLRENKKLLYKISWPTSRDPNFKSARSTARLTRDPIALMRPF
jgi:hypothetical protein